MTVVLRASGWSELPGTTLAPLYASIQRCLDGRRPEVVVRERRDLDSLTLAEAWGRYVSDLAYFGMTPRIPSSLARFESCRG